MAKEKAIVTEEGEDTMLTAGQMEVPVATEKKVVAAENPVAELSLDAQVKQLRKAFLFAVSRINATIALDVKELFPELKD